MARERRALRILVWVSRAIGWSLTALAFAAFMENGEIKQGLSTLMLVSSLALGLIAVTWIVGLELFLRFFDRFLSHN